MVKGGLKFCEVLIFDSYFYRCFGLNVYESPQEPEFAG